MKTGNKVTYRGYEIHEKKDFGSKPFLIDGFMVAHGYVVTDGICNVIPGAGWFLTVQDALTGIDDLIAAGDCSDTFHALRKARREGRERQSMTENEYIEITALENIRRALDALKATSPIFSTRLRTARELLAEEERRLSKRINLFSL